MAKLSNKRHQLLFTWTLRSVVVLLLVSAGAWFVRDKGEEAVLPGAEVEGLTSVLTRSGSTGECPIRFEDVTSRMGLTFRHFPAERTSLLPEDMGSGVACGDFDNDGWTDIFLANLAGPVTDPLPENDDAARCRLFRNMRGEGFEDVTESSGLGWIAFAMGASWGDYDNDDDPDLYVTAFGKNALFNNRGDGTFENVIERTGTQDARFSAGCSWGDYDRDGDIDLYVCNYVDFVFRQADRGVVKRQYDTEQPYTLNPSSYAPASNSLFRNRGDGTFESVAEQAGVADTKGRSLSASWCDMDNDGWIDLYVANDVSENGVFRNRGDGTFENVGPGSLAADYRGAMGIAVADFDRDQDLDLLITHWIAQENALFRNMVRDEKIGDSSEEAQRLWFLDAADEVGLGQSSLDMVGWATGFVDFDNDGLLDLWLVNGSTLEIPSDHLNLERQPALLFRQQGEETYVDVAAKASERLGEPFVGRGGAMLDFDQDGRMDLVILKHGEDALLLRNTSEHVGHWMGIELRQTGANTRALGARAYLTTGGVTRMADVGSSPSYMSQHEMLLHFGLGESESVERLRIVWPDGTEETHEDLAVDQVLRFEHAHDPQVGEAPQ